MWLFGTDTVSVSSLAHQLLTEMARNLRHQILPQTRLLNNTQQDFEEDKSVMLAYFHWQKTVDQ